MQNRLTRAQALHDTRDWVQERRARTRQLIELGSLVQKADLVELLQDDRAALLGAMMDLADQLRGASDADPAHLRARWRRAGMRAFEADKDANTAQPPATPSNAARTRTPPLNQKA